MEKVTGEELEAMKKFKLFHISRDRSLDKIVTMAVKDDKPCWYNLPDNYAYYMVKGQFTDREQLDHPLNCLHMIIRWLLDSKEISRT